MNLLMLLLAGAIVALDQWTKFLVVELIPQGGCVSALPGLFHLTYVKNTGAAFSLFQGMQWLFLVVFVLFTVALVWILVKNKLPFSAFERCCILAMWAGGLGNMIDRLRLGYVVDMIAVEFIRFPVFNVADCFITCGCVALMVSILLVNREFWKEDEK